MGGGAASYLVATTVKAATERKAGTRSVEETTTTVEHGLRALLEPA